MGTGAITCISCGKNYPWKPEYAGQRVQCKCGRAMTVPLASPAQQEDDMYDLAPSDATPKPVAPQPTKVLGYQAPRAAITEQPIHPAIVDPMKDLKIPLALIAIGTLIHFAEAFFRLPHGAKTIGQGFAFITLGLIIDVGIMLIGLFAAAKLRGLAFGPFWIGVMKLCAISLAPGAAYTVIMLMLHPLGIIAVLIGWVASFCLYFALFGMLFDLGESDTWFCVVVIFIMRLLSVFVVLNAVF